MDSLKGILSITNALNVLLKEAPDTNDREQMIRQINELLDKREIFLKQTKDIIDYTEDEKRLGKQILKLNQEVEVRLTNLFNEIKSEIQSMQKQKKFKQNYTNPYEFVQLADGMFLDSKQ